MKKVIIIIIFFINFILLCITGCLEDSSSEPENFDGEFYGSWQGTSIYDHAGIKWTFHENNTLEMIRSIANVNYIQYTTYEVKSNSRICIISEDGTENCFDYQFTSPENNFVLIDSNQDEYFFIRI